MLEAVGSTYQLAAHCRLLPWGGCGSNAIEKGRLRTESQPEVVVRMRKIAMAIPSQGEPPSSISAVLQGFVVVSGAGWAMLPQLLRFGSSYGALAGLTSRPASARSQRAPHTLKAVAVFTSLHAVDDLWYYKIVTKYVRSSQCISKIPDSKVTSL